MEIGELLAFYEVVMNKGFNKAAVKLYISQPALTCRIRNLEEELGEVLLIRTGKGVQLSEAGKVFFPYVKRIFAILQEGRKAITEAKGHINLSIATIPSIGLLFIPKAVQQIYNLHLKSNIQIHTCHSKTALELLLDELVDASFVAASIPHRMLSFTTMWKEPIILVANPQTPLRSYKSLSADHLRKTRIILSDWGESFPSFLKHLQENPIHPLNFSKIDSFETITCLLNNPSNVSFLPKYVILPELHSGELIELPFKKNQFMYRSVYFVTRKGSTKAPLQMLEDSVKDALKSILSDSSK